VAAAVLGAMGAALGASDLDGGHRRCLIAVLVAATNRRDHCRRRNQGLKCCCPGNHRPNLVGT
jgi:hypothetical protein